MQGKIHPTAIIEPGAEIGNNVTIQPYAIIKSTVTLKKYPQLSAVTTFNSTIGRDGMTERYGEGLSYNRDFRFTKISSAKKLEINTIFEKTKNAKSQNYQNNQILPN